MNFDWSQYFALAEILAKQGEEAQLRTAISRAYYSAFHGARAWLRARDMALTASIESHRDVWDAFDRQQERLCVRIAAEGKRLRKNRNDADYENRVPNLSSEVQKAISRARMILKLLDDASARHPPRR